MIFAFKFNCSKYFTQGTCQARGSEREGERKRMKGERERGGGRKEACLMTHHKRITAHGDKF